MLEVWRIIHNSYTGQLWTDNIAKLCAFYYKPALFFRRLKTFYFMQLLMRLMSVHESETMCDM
jgi:hypothetical protein